jgi:hypothetical protein
MKNAIYWDVTLSGSCKNQYFRGKLVLTRATWRNISEDGILDIRLISMCRKADTLNCSLITVANVTTNITLEQSAFMFFTP